MTDEQTQDTEQEQDQGQGGSAGDEDEVAKARKAAEEEEKAKERVKELEEDPPAKLEDWPDDKAKYETFGGAEGQESYEESVTSKLGPSSLRYREDGGVEIEGEEVDDPDEYKSEPIPGGPTDPDAPQDLTSQKISERQGRDGGGSSDDDDSESESESESKAESDEDDSPDSKSSNT